MLLSLQKKKNACETCARDRGTRNHVRCFSRRISLASAALAVFFSVLFDSCMTMADYDFSSIDRRTARGEYTAALSLLEQDSSHIYSEHDKVLYLLDKGMLLQYAEDRKASNESLSQAEQLIYDYYSKSITQGIGSYIANDTVVDYAGETYEDIYTNVFMALNYIQEDDTENALVEIRRFDNKLKEVTQKYQAELAQVQQQLADENSLHGATIEFHNSALARYLSMILYRSTNDFASAEVDSRLLKNAFETEPDIYDFSIPSTVAEELAVTKQEARLNVLMFTGNAPVKRENIMRIASPNGFYYKVALPEMVKRGSSIERIEVTARNEQTGGTARMDAEKIESIENIAFDTYRQHRSLIYGRSVARSLLKSTTTTVFGALEENADNSSDRELYHNLRLISTMATEFSERADVRTSRFFPAAANVAGLTLAPGRYTVTVAYCANSGKRIETKTYEHVAVAAGKLNLIESVCLR